MFQARWINWDRDIYYEEEDIPAKCRTSNLNEDLGRVHYLFSDKTGTLTRNEMVFKKCSINGFGYGTLDPNIAGFKDEKACEKAKNPDSLEHAFFSCLAVCHSVLPQTGPNNEVVYEASSPDELALVNGAKDADFVFYVTISLSLSTLTLLTLIRKGHQKRSVSQSLENNVPISC